MLINICHFVKVSIATLGPEIAAKLSTFKLNISIEDKEIIA